ncbi:MAG TPA: D-alanyl-D-alanine carboxypeptidase/D-alanyl-D-alanine-endopeptidase [Candidatus Acidoferrum sp.]|nr:D-alanyl-D-alanine carboxypeptidase/D-alanyl-D-alanine-endopeptidase [Candidatus Acidoferrum sp.]
MSRTYRRLVLFAVMCAVFICSAPVASAGTNVSRATRAAGSSAAARLRPDVRRFDERVNAALAKSQAQRIFWGVEVADRDTGQILYQLNADHFFMPASNAKLFVTSLALATLGGSYQYHTTLESAARIGPDGKLAGDLVFVGRGDPDLSNVVFPYQLKTERSGPVEKVLGEMADAAVAKGLKEVDGDVVADDSYFPYDPYPEGWSIGDIFFDFGAPVSAITFNDNVVRLQIAPGSRAGDPAIVQVQPAVASESMTAQITTAPAGGHAYFSVSREPAPNFLSLTGTIPQGQAPTELDLAMIAPAETAARALKQLLEQRGVKITGTVRVVHAPPPQTSDENGFSPPPPPPQPSAAGANPFVLAEHLSPPLIESVRFTNKVSQNLHAELFLRTVGRVKAGFGSAEQGLKIEQAFLRKAGIADGDVLLSDGSGLARDDLVTPRAVIALLEYDARQAWGAEFMSTLPLAGVDGTLESRMKGITGPAVIQAKTGSLEHVHSMSGYAKTYRGENLVFSIFANNETQHGNDATEALDAIAEAMVQTLGGPRASPKKKRK